MERLSIVCSACRCHVRVGERGCPHCGAAFAAPAALRRPSRGAARLHRVLIATALAALGGAACGGRVANEDILGTCGGSGASAAKQVVPCGGCMCGTGATCVASGQCVSCNCEANETCDSEGKCSASPWFRLPSQGGCYGTPPLPG